MNRKHQQNINQVSVNVSLLVGNAIQIKSGITLNIGLSAKIEKAILCMKKIIFEIMLLVGDININMSQKSVIFVAIGNFLDKGFEF